MGDREASGRARALALPLLFGACLLLSATLLFVVQPMVARMVLPRLGGSPSVWNACVVFFQTLLLAGYGYAHLLTSRLRLAVQVALHASLLAAATLILPLAIPESSLPPVDRSPLLWLLPALSLYVGPPVLLLAASAPLLQSWFSRTDHHSAGDPYFLYVASNAGSILALLLYPAVIEPAWSISEQAAEWASGFQFLIVLVAAAGLLAVWRRSGVALLSPAPRSHPPARTTWLERFQWLLLSAVPSSLMLGVTMYLSTDIAAVPLLWIAPLVLYLLSFVLAFMTRPLVKLELLARLVPLIMLPALLSIVTSATWSLPVSVTAHGLVFFVCAWYLHASLARTRPEPVRLTEYYLWIALGGAAGGVVNTFIAPVLFTSVLEYPLALALVALVPAAASAGRPGWLVPKDLLLPALAGAATGVIAAALPADADVSIKAFALSPVVVWSFSFSRRPLRFGATLLAFVAAASAFLGEHGERLFVDRTFFGVMWVERDRATGRHQLYHGNTLHGEQAIEPGRPPEPLSYFSRVGPIGQLIEQLGPSLDGANVGVVGLGVGSLAAYARPGQHWTFFELDPAMERLARDPSLFTYLDDCGERCDVVLGDARLSLDAIPPGRFELLVLDAFSSDAIPVHLLTREAVQLYRSRVTLTGVIAFHVSNNYLDLRPVLAGLGREAGLTVLTQFHQPATQAGGIRPSIWVVMGPPDRLRALGDDARWREPGAAVQRPWTDAYSNILDALRWRQR